MTTASGGGLDADLETVRFLLERLGVTPEQLLGLPSPARRPAPMPTLGEYIDRVAGVISPGTRKVYEPYWHRVIAAWGHRRLDEPTALEIKELSEQARTTAVVRRNSRDGRSAAEHLIAGLRCVYQFAVLDGLIAEGDNPAARVKKPRRLASARHALPDDQLAAINQTAATTGNDPELDTLLIRLHTETACRRGGALVLRRSDLDPDQCLVRLREKGQTVRWQPVSPTLMYHLVRHGETRRDQDSDGQLLRYANGRPITLRRYDHLWQRLGKHLPWVATQQITTHWLRHTTLTWVERRFGYAVARAYAGHEGRGDAGTTATYVKADLYEVAAALSELTGELHPLAKARAQPTASVASTRLHSGLTARYRFSPLDPCTPEFKAEIVELCQRGDRSDRDRGPRVGQAGRPGH